MKTIILFIFAVFLIACQSPTAPVQTATGDKVTRTYVIKNSKWDTVAKKTVTMSRTARAATDDTAIPPEVQDPVDAYNAMQVSDLYRIYLEGQDPAIELSGTVTVYICNPFNNNVNMVAYDIPRTLLVSNYAGWVKASEGQVLYIDHIPPAPIQEKDVNPYAWYTLTVKDDDTGDIVYVTHSGYNPDQSISAYQTWILTPEADGGGGWATVETYYDQMLRSWGTMAQSPVTGLDGTVHQHCSLVAHEVYVKPVLVPPTI